MKQQIGTKFFKIALIAVLVVALASVFAACGEKETGKNNSTNGNGGTTGDGIMINGIPTEEELEACIAFVYNTTRNGDNAAGFYFDQQSDDEGIFRGIENIITISNRNYHYNDNTDSYEGLNLYVFNFKDEKSAEDALSFANANNYEGYMRKGKQLYYMSLFNEQESLNTCAKSIDEISAVIEEIKASKLPTDAMTKTRHDFIIDTFNQKLNKEALADENIKYAHGSYDVYEGSESFYCNIEYNNTGATFFTVWSNDTVFMDMCREYLQNLEELYTSDSYVDFDKEEGFVFAKLTDKVKDDSEIEQ